VTNLPLSGINVERGEETGAHATLFPP
jgi:hypothetical protein